MKKNKYSFNDDQQVSQSKMQVNTTVQVQKNKEGQRGKKGAKYKFDFNQSDQQQIIYIDKADTLEHRTVDSLGNASQNNNLSSNILPSIKPTNFKSNETLLQKVIIKEKHQTSIPQQRKNIQTSYVPSQIQQTNIQSSIANYPANIQLHFQELSYIQNLSSIIFTTLFSDLDSNILNNQKLKNNKSFNFNNDYLVRGQAQIFMSLLLILQQKESNGQNIKKYLRQWCIINLKKINKDPKHMLVDKNNKNYKLIMFAEYRLQELAMQLLQKGYEDQALIISNIEDMASYKRLSSKNLQLNHCYTIIQGQNIKIIPKISWLVDLALAIIYFRNLKLQDIIMLIYKKYQKTEIKHLPSSFLALILAFRRQNKASAQYEAFILKIINTQSRLKYLHQVFIFYSLKKYTNISKSILSTISNSLISKFNSPKLFLEFIVYINLKDQQEYRQILQIYLKNMISVQTQMIRLQKLLSSIQTYQIDEQQPEQIIQLKKWRKYKQFQLQTKKRQSYPAIKHYIQYYNEIQTCILAQKSQIQQYILDNIVSFQFLCTFREMEKKKNLQLLYKLESMMRKVKIFQIVEGCISFMEMKLNIFNIFHNNKIESLWALNTLFMNSITDNNKQKIKFNIQRVLKTLLNTNDGKIYISNQLKQLCSNKSSKQRYIKLLSNQLKYQKQDDAFKNSKITKILSMLGQNNEFQRFALINLIFQ